MFQEKHIRSFQTSEAGQPDDLFDAPNFLPIVDQFSAPFGLTSYGFEDVDLSWLQLGPADFATDSTLSQDCVSQDIPILSPPDYPFSDSPTPSSSQGSDRSAISTVEYSSSIPLHLNASTTFHCSHVGCGRRFATTAQAKYVYTTQRYRHC